MEYYPFIFMIIALATFFIIRLWKSNENRIEQAEKYEDQLIEQIKHKETYLNDLIKETQNPYQKAKLSNIENNIIEIYDRSNIRIPLDIIEELSFQKFDNEKDIYNYIENQRNYWKLENTKKPFKL